MNTGNKNPNVDDEDIPFSQQPTSSPLVYDFKKNKKGFPPLNDSNSFSTVDSDAHVSTKIGYSIIHVFRSTGIQELNILKSVSELERTQLLTILAMFVQNPQLAGLLIGNRSNFLYVEGSSAW